MAQGAPSTKDFLNKLKNKASVAAPVAPEMPQQEQAAAPAGMAPQTEDAIVRAGIQLGPQLLGLLSGGYEGAESAKRNVTDPFFSAQAEAAKNAAAQAKAQAEREEKLAEMAAKKEFGEKKLAIDEYDAKTKRMALNKEHKEDKIKPTQYTAANFARRVELAEDTFSKLAEGGYDPTSKGSWLGGKLPEMFKSNEAKLQQQGERNFVNAVLRRESGAAISPSEFASAEAQYFPRVGDTPEVIEQKRLNRQIAKDSLTAEAGQAMESVPSALGQSRKPVGSAGVNPVKQAQAAGLPADKIAQYAKQHGLTEEKAAQIILARKAAQGGKK